MLSNKYLILYNSIKTHNGGSLGNKVETMSKILSDIMKKHNIQNDQYVIIASYCLHKYREIGDLDVVVDASVYNRLRDSNMFEISTAAISKDERLVLKLPMIDEDAEIEIFPKERHIGFPSNDYSLDSLHNNNMLLYDANGNPYFNEKTCIDLYSSITVNDGNYYTYNFKIKRDRVIKNISHLTLIRDNTDNAKIRDYCNMKINYLSSLI